MSVDQKAQLLNLEAVNADPDDLPEVRDLVYHIFEEYGLERLIKWYEENPDVFAREYLGKDLRRRRSHLILADTTVMGCGILIPRMDVDDPSWGEISKLYLAANIRGQGLGRAILEDLIEAAPVWFDKLYLTTRSEFEEAIWLYTSVGFVPSKEARYQSRCSVAMELKL